MSIRRIFYLILLTIGILAACSKDEPQTVAAPEIPLEFIDSIFPADEATNVPLNCCVTVTFLRPMDTATLAANKFYFSGGLLYTLYRDKNKATICPAGGLQHGAEYTLTIGAGIADTDGNVMPQPFSFSFKTIIGNPLIASFVPMNGKTDVSLKPSIVIVFTEDMDATTINASTVSLSEVPGATISYAGRILRIQPPDSLRRNHNYMVTLKSTIATAGGTPLGQDYSWSFTTVDASAPYIAYETPVNESEDVSVNTSIKLEFSQSIDPASVTTDEFTVSGGVTGVLQKTYRVITFVPNRRLEGDSVYTASFRGDVTDLTGKVYNINFSWSFRTEAMLDMDIVSVSPEDGSIVGGSVRPTIVFARNLVSGCVATDEFTLAGDNPVSGIITIVDRTVTFVPAGNLPSDVTYTAAFNGDIIDEYGDTTQVNYTWSFIVTPFDLIAWSPDAGCAPINASIVLEFSHPVDPATAAPANIILWEGGTTPIMDYISADGNVVTIYPSEPLKPLTQYKIEILTALRDASGSFLVAMRTKYFTTRSENLLPLAIGNKWVYEVSQWGYNILSSTHLDSIYIVRDSMIDGQNYYIDQRNKRYKCSDNIIQTTFIRFNPMYSIIEFDNNDCENGSLSTINLDIGTFICQHFQVDVRWTMPTYNIGYNFAPNIGLVDYSVHVFEGTSGSDSYETWELISYELQ